MEKRHAASLKRQIAQDVLKGKLDMALERVVGIHVPHDDGVLHFPQHRPGSGGHAAERRAVKPWLHAGHACNRAMCLFDLLALCIR